MQLEDLKTPGFLPSAIKLRSEAYRAISYASTQADLTNGESDTAATLLAFFQDCAEKTKALIPAKKATTSKEKT